MQVLLIDSTENFMIYLLILYGDVKTISCRLLKCKLIRITQIIAKSEAALLLLLCLIQLLAILETFVILFYHLPFGSNIIDLNVCMQPFSFMSHLMHLRAHLLY